MDISVDQPALSRALRLVGRAVPTRPTIPSLAGVVLTSEGSAVTLAATDLDLALVTRVPAEVTVPGRVAVPARLLSEYVAGLPPSRVQLSLDSAKGRLRAFAGRASASLATFDPESFPRFAEPDEKLTVECSGDALRAAIGRVAFAAGEDPGRPALAAVLFDLGPERLDLVATDGFRLARTHLALAFPERRRLLVPARAAGELARIVAETKSVGIALATDGNALVATAGPTTLSCRLIDGAYPDVERVIPREWRTRVSVDTASLRQAVRLLSVFGDRREARVVLVSAEAGSLRLRARGDDSGDAESEIEAEVSGAAQTIALNAELLPDLLDAVSSNALVLEWETHLRPLLIREAPRVQGAETSEKPSTDLWLTMPLHDPQLARREPPTVAAA
jgi:DNA polymerase III subunit beta